MSQHNLWIDTLTDAVMALIDACGGPKKVGAELRPDLDAESAGEWLFKALSPKRREVLSAEQLIKLLAVGRHHGCHVLMGFIAQQACYVRPEPIQLEHAVADATARMNDLQERMVREMDRLQRLTVVLNGASHDGHR